MQNSNSPFQNTIFTFLLIIHLSILFPLSLSAREFTDSKGRKIEAEITGAAPGGQVEILLKGKKMMVPTTLFSLDDQDFIAKWIKAHPDALVYRFNYYVDLDELRKNNRSQGGLAFNDKLKTKPQKLLVNVTNLNPGPVTDLRIVANAIVEDAVNAIDGSYFKLAVGYKKKDVVQTQHIKAEGKFPMIQPKGRAEIIFEFDIESYVDRDGRRVDGAATDRVLGAWVRVYKGDKMVGEYKRSFHSNFDKASFDDNKATKARSLQTKTK